MPNAGFAQPASAAPTAQAATRPASTEMAALTPAAPVALPAAPSEPPIEAVKRHLTASRPVSRADTLFDDAQLTRIKRRLHLTADQERMWPAVAVALHNIGHEQKRQARSRGQQSGINPNSEAVRDLKSAAIPLLMSFSDEQKGEVRNLARNMGLEQLASEF
jgi:hypothetical protein